MANVLRTIGATTGSSSTIGAAITWGQDSDNYTRVTDDVLILQIVDAAEYNETNTLSAFTGVATASKYVRLETESTVRHDGTYNTAKARIRGTSGSHCLTMGENYTHLRHLAIFQDSTTDSAECIRISASTRDLLIEKSVLRVRNQSTQDCIYAGGYAATDIAVFDCVCLLDGTNARAGIHAQNYQGTSNHTWYIEHCSLMARGSGAGGTGCIAGNDGSTGTVTLNCYNNIAFGTGSAPAEDFEDTGGCIWTGAGNFSSDGSATNRFSGNNQSNQTISVTDEAATEILVTSLTAGSENLQLIDGASSSDGALGYAEAGSTRDSRIDLTEDIAGNPRPGTYGDRDCGAFQTVVAGGETKTVTMTGDGGVTFSRTVSRYRSLAISGSGSNAFSRAASRYRSLTYAGAGAPTESSQLGYLRAHNMSASGTSAPPDKILGQAVVKAFAATAGVVFSKLTARFLSFSTSGSAAVERQRGISLEKTTSATGSVSSGQTTGEEFEGTPTGTGTSSLSRTTGLSTIRNAVGSAAVAIGKGIGKGFGYIGRGTSVLTGDDFIPDSGRGVLRLMIRAILRDKTRDK